MTVGRRAGVSTLWFHQGRSVSIVKVSDQLTADAQAVSLDSGPPHVALLAPEYKRFDEAEVTLNRLVIESTRRNGLVDLGSLQQRGR